MTTQITSVSTRPTVTGLRLTHDQALGSAIRALMGDYGLYQEDLAPVLGVGRATASRKLKGLVTWKAEEVSLVAHLFGIRVDDLMPTMDEQGNWIRAQFPDKAKAPTEVRALLEQYAIRDSNPGPTD